MSISIQLTDEQAKQLAADIIKLNRPDEPSPLPELPTEPALPEPPEGFHKAMMGPLKLYAPWGSNDVARYLDGEWQSGAFMGNCGIPYALRIGSEIAKLNGLEPETKPDTARREFYLFPSEPSLGHYPVHQVRMDRLEQVTVREVLPGDPTPEQVQALVDACWEWRDVPHHEDIRKALAPFRKP